MKYLSLFCLLVVMSWTSCQSSKENGLTNDQPVDLVYPFLDTENSRWFFFSSASRPFGMVNLSPDTEVGGAWGSGYRYNTDTVKGFSHIHAWQLSGVSIMPVDLKNEIQADVFTDFYSKFDHSKEKVSPGYHYLELDRYRIAAELTSTKRVGFHKYSFHDESIPAVLLNLNGLLGPCLNSKGEISLLKDGNLNGKLVGEQTIRRPKPVTIFFHIAFEQPIQNIEKDRETGNYLITFDSLTDVLKMKVAISYTSKQNALNNLNKELDHWDFGRVVDDSKDEWNSLLSRIKVKGGSENEQRRFYTDLWHALQGRRIISDANGAYPDNTDQVFRIGKIPLDETGKPKFNHYNSDSFWGAQWTLNTLWGLVYPDIYKQFVQSLMQYYKDGGRVPRGPSGGNYTYVMTGATATPFVISAIQKGIIKEQHKEIYQALKEGHVSGGIMAKAGYEHKTSLGGGLDYYMDLGYVPYPIPEGPDFGFHQDGASLTSEYAYQDWTLAQLALRLRYEEDAKYFLKRSKNYQNTYDVESGWMRPKDVNGVWKSDFDPYQYENGFNESNGAQSSWFVPHDVQGLAELMGGNEIAVARLNEQFEVAERLNFTSGNAHAQEKDSLYSRIPINYGNQPSIQTAFLFHELGRPDLSQYWSSRVVEEVFSGLSTSTGYNGDEDQGLMGSLAVLMKMGLFQLTGGTEDNPKYLIGSPAFDRIEIELNPEYYPGDQLVIQVEGNKEERVLSEIYFNDESIPNARVDHNRLIGGGVLKLVKTP